MTIVITEKDFLEKDIFQIMKEITGADKHTFSDCYEEKCGPYCEVNGEIDPNAGYEPDYENDDNYNQDCVDRARDMREAVTGGY